MENRNYFTERDVERLGNTGSPNQAGYHLHDPFGKSRSSGWFSVSGRNGDSPVFSRNEYKAGGAAVGGP